MHEFRNVSKLELLELLQAAVEIKNDLNELLVETVNLLGDHGPPMSVRALQ